MGSQHNLRGLEWLVDEVEANLIQAYESLDRYLQDAEDQSQLRFCLGYVHQVHGSLKIAESYSGLLLADEMEQLVSAMLEDRVSSVPEAAEVLVQAIHKLPAYLHQLIDTRRDRPETLLMLLNDIRAVRGEQLASENALFAPLLDFASSGTGTGTGKFSVTSDDAFRELMKKLRQMYQLALLGLLKGKEVDKNAANLEKVFARARELCRGSSREHLWRVAGAVTEGLFHHSIALGIAVRVLLRELDSEFRQMTGQGRAALELPFPEALAKNLLFYVAHSGAKTPRISKVSEDFCLDRALPAGSVAINAKGLVPSYDQATVKLISAEILEDLESVKENIEAFVQGRGDSAVGLQVATAAFKRMADTLAMVGQGRLRDSVAGIMSLLAAQLDSGRPDDKKALEALAELIIELESGIGIWAANQYQSGTELQESPAEQRIELSRAQQSLLREIRNGIERIKEGVVQYISSKKDSSYLTDLPGIVNEITGAMVVVGLDRTAEIFRRCGQFIKSKMIGDKAGPDWMALDALADAITSVEFYLEAMGKGSADDEKEMLKVAATSLRRLGYPLPDSLETEILADVTAREGSPVVAGKEVSLATGKDAVDTVAGSPPEPEIVVAATGQISTGQEQSAAGALPENASEMEIAQLPESVPETGEAANETREQEQAVDPEIREIFVEEAREVLDQLRQSFALWSEQPDHREHLSVLRRCFHTIKGSGRMVGADAIGELAWAVEHMMNRVLDKRIELDSTAVALVNSVIALLPEMIEAFAEQRDCYVIEQAARLKAGAEALARGEHVSLDMLAPGLNAEVAASEAAPEIALDPEQSDSAADLLSGDEAPVTNGPAVSEPVPGAIVVSESEDAGLESEPENREQEGSDQELVPQESSEDRELIAIFAKEAEDHIAAIESFIATARTQDPEPVASTSALQRALHTLKGSAQMASVGPVARLVVPLEGFVRELLKDNRPIDRPIVNLLEQGCRACRHVIDNFGRTSATEQSEAIRFLEELDALRALIPSTEPGDGELTGASGSRAQLLSRFMSEEMASALDFDVFQEHWRQHPDSFSEPLRLQAEALNGIAGSARESGEFALADLTGKMAAAYHHISSSGLAPVPAIVDPLQAGHEALLSAIDALAADQDIPPIATTLIDCIGSLIEMEQPESEPVRAMDLIKSDAAASVETPDEEPQPAEPPQEQEKQVAEAIAAKPADGILLPADLDEEIVGIFLEEAEELLEQSDQSIQSWQQDHRDQSAIALIKRALHTFKGGARMAGLAELGDASHDFESFAIAGEQRLDSLDEDFFGELFRRNDLLLRAVEGLRRLLASEDAAASGAPELVRGERHVDSAETGSAGAPKIQQPAATEHEPAERDLGGEALTAANLGDEESMIPAEETDARAAPATVSWPSARVIPFTGKPLGSNIAALAEDAENGKGKPRFSVPGKEFTNSPLSTPERQSGPEEMVKISAPVLDNLVNLAGETSISRGQIEQQLSAFIYSLDEMESTIWRLQDQVRRLSVETDAQVMFRRERIEFSKESEDFDPLEMDRYSQLQQLSRALLESASDLQDLKETMLDKSRDAEALLLQQSRINTDLQESLMRTRMVPFSRLVPRLRRIVRQVSGEVGKPVALKLQSVEGEMDRSVLEKMLPPLEHMIRNSIDHGIESAATREQAGKSEEGSIELGFSRDGGDVVIRLIDDGQGLDINAIRKRAIDRGLMDAEAILSDREISQFIFEPGFSTASTVTQVSGRGVGMDVVNSEVRQLGGSIDIRSEPGTGTEFIIRLPFTVSVNRVLMIEVGEDSYALGLNAMNGVVRLDRDELEYYYRNPQATLEHAGISYEVRYLGSLLNDQVQPNRDTVLGQVFLILVRAEQRHYAVQVDGLIGTREIVVKTLGNQFSTVQGLSGATIMGDGRVVVILDLPALMRAQKAAPAIIAQKPLPTPNQSVSTIMVVDDSVTVRKVTGRFLEREGYRVLTARDGLDAMRVLQDNTPDLMLLDIEMPKMDGFEVARLVRTTRRLENMPIIMITSRTGAKHRERALSMGVNRFLGKPYQEDTLLAAVQELLGAVAATG